LFYQIAIKGHDELGLAPDPRTGREMPLLRMLAFRPVSTESGSSGTGPLKVVKPAAPKAAQPAPAKPAAAKPVTPSAGGQDADEQREPELFSAPCSIPPMDQQQAAKTSTPADSDWMSLQGELEISGQVRELARNVHLQSRSDDHWDFVITPSLRHLGSQNCINRLGQAISQKVGHTVAINLIDSDSTELITADALDKHKNLQNMSEAERAINDDPTVKALKEQLGARIVEDSIQPLQ